MTGKDSPAVGVFHVLFYRRAAAARVTAEIARRTHGLVEVPLQTATLAPRVCGACRGAGRSGSGRTCPRCGGARTTRRFMPDDPAHPVLVQGPCGLGYQRLVAVALADGRLGYVHIRHDSLPEMRLYVFPPALRRAHPHQRLAAAR